MKNQKLLIPLLVVLLFFVSIFKQISNVVENNKDYNSYIAKAREQASLGVVTALENYEKALEMNPNIEIYLEIADFFKQQNLSYDLIDWCEEIINKYPTDARGFEYIIDAYITDERYDRVFDYIYEVEDRGVVSNKITEIKKKYYYYYDFDYSRFDNVSVFSNGLCASQYEEKWGYANMYGDHVINTSYYSVGDFMSVGFAPVVDTDGSAYFINRNNEKIMATSDDYKSFGNISQDLFPAQLPSGKYVFLDMDFKRVSKNTYDYVSTFNYNVAAVMNNGKWSIIDVDENVILGNLDDVILDEKEICCRNDRIFVKSNGSDYYIMVNSSGEKIGNSQYSDAFLFNDNTYAAVYRNGAWSFIDKDGNDALKKTFTGARSFSNGLAAISVADEWGFIDMEGNIVIEPAFDDAKDFTDKGSVFVKEDNYWRLLKLYSLNRE